MKIFEQIINGVQIGCAVWSPIAAAICLVMSYLDIGIKEGYTQEYAIAYGWVFLAVSVVYAVVIALVNRKYDENVG